MTLSKSKLNYLKSLHRGRYRQKYQNFIAEGTKIVEEMLLADDVEIELIVALPQWIADNIGLIKRFTNKLCEVDDAELREVSMLSTPNQVLVVAKQLNQKLDLEAAHAGLTLYLDRIQDPGNLGTILRIADWFGVRNVVRGPGTADVFNPKVVQASMGAFLRVRSPQLELQELKNLLPDIPLLGAALEGQSIYHFDFPKSAILVFGNESAGLTEELKKKSDWLISIPKGKNGGAESLNAAVAAGILVAQWARVYD